MTKEVKALRMTNGLKHYLIEHRGGSLRRITVYEDQERALRAFHAAERQCPPFWAHADPAARCVLLSSDSLKSCMTTHGSWFDHDLGFPEFASIATERTLMDWCPEHGYYTDDCAACLKAENTALKEALADAGFGPGFWFRGWERAREHFQRQAKGKGLNDG